MTIHKAGDGDLRRATLEHAAVSKATPMPPVTTRVFGEPVFPGQPRVTGLEYFHRRVSAVSIYGALGVIAVAACLAAPSAAIDVVVGVILARIRVNPAKEEITGTPSAGSRYSIGYRLTEAGKENIDDTLKNL